MPLMLGRSWYGEREAKKQKEVVTKSGHQMRMAQSLCHERDGPDPVGRCSDAELLTVGTHSFAGLEMHFWSNNKVFSGLLPVLSDLPGLFFGISCGLHWVDILWQQFPEPHGSLRAPVYTTWYDR